MPEPRQLQQPREPAVLARHVFALQQQPEAVFEIERDHIGRAALFVKRVRHRREFQAVQEVGGLLRKHRYASPVMRVSWCGLGASAAA